jgi:hypothetical protein
MRQTLQDFGLEYSKVSLLCDNENAVKIAYNPVLHGKTKHVENSNHDIEPSFTDTKDQLTDLFTKPLDERKFIELRHELNILDASNVACSSWLI